VETRKRIAILGSTGSIGTQTLDIIAEYPTLFKAEILIAGSKVEHLIEQCRQFHPSLAIIANESYYHTLKEAIEPLGIEVAAGSEAIIAAMSRDNVDTVVTATVGYSGLAPTIAAIKANKEIALANKETLVVAGELINKLLKSSSSRIIPVDSEHSAIYQCLQGECHDSIRRIIITASGGPFRALSKERLTCVTVHDALNHPNWSMGAKITIDSATMLNKAFEIIEAHWLFNVDADRIDAVVHPQSIVHSMVEFNDGAVKAQLGLPDMHLPIRYALGETLRLPTSEKGLSIADYATLTFERPDTDKFPCLTLAYHALEQKGNTACIINAANEIAVAAFLNGKIRFIDIHPLIMETLHKVNYIATPTYEDYVQTNSEARLYAESLIKTHTIN
jgi:1-deoxy-D-xylulose-5-phosphate reductoisomerase